MKNIANIFVKAGAKLKSDSIFKRAATLAKATYNRSTMETDMAVRAGKMIGNLAGHTNNVVGGAYNTTKKALSKSINFGKSEWARMPSKPTRPPGNFQRFARTATRNVVAGGLLSVGAVGMLSVGIMNGINNASKDIVLERYLSDQRFSRDILMQSRVGLSMGTNQMNRMGSTIGLSNALSKTRHGARY